MPLTPVADWDLNTPSIVMLTEHSDFNICRNFRQLSIWASLPFSFHENKEKPASGSALGCQTALMNGRESERPDES